MDTTSATAMLVGTRDMLSAHPNAVTTTIARGEVEEALGSELPAELVLDVLRPAHDGVEAETRSVTVAWDRADLESLLADTDADAITFSFDLHELEQAFAAPDFEGHGLRETAMILTVAAAAAMGASAASGMPYQEQGASTVSVTAITTAAPDAFERAVARVAPAPDAFERAVARGAEATGAHDETTLASRGIETVSASATAAPDAFERAVARVDVAPPGHDEATLASRGIDQPVATGHDEATLASRGIDPQPLASGRDEATLVARGIEQAPAPAGDSGSGRELPSLDASTIAAVAGGLAGVGLLIVAAGFAAGRNRIRPV